LCPSGPSVKPPLTTNIVLFVSSNTRRHPQNRKKNPQNCCRFGILKINAHVKASWPKCWPQLSSQNFRLGLGLISLRPKLHYLALLWICCTTYQRYNNGCRYGEIYNKCTAGQNYNDNKCTTNFFASRIVNVWNSLPATVDFNSLAAFKKTVKRADLSAFLLCSCT